MILIIYDLENMSHLHSSIFCQIDITNTIAKKNKNKKESKPGTCSMSYNV